MTPAEVEAVLVLWKQVPECKPKLIKWEPKPLFGRSAYWEMFPPCGIPIDDATADAIICGHLRRWLEERCFRIDMSVVPVEVFGLDPVEVRLVTKPNGVDVFRTATTHLLALIGAVLVVAGTTGQPQTQAGKEEELEIVEEPRLKGRVYIQFTAVVPAPNPPVDIEDEGNPE